MGTRADRVVAVGLLVLAAGVFLTGIGWGLPSHAADGFLFGSVEPWGGQKVLSLAGGWGESNLGADVDVNPLNRDGVIEVNATDAGRAAIVLRYRMYSYQPDEMITFRSLSKIRQRHGDPRLYQYGGLWVYPVGALLGLAKVVQYVELKGDPAWYIDHPEAFGRFYVVARFYSALWGVAGAWAVYALARRLMSHRWLPAIAGVAFIFLPVVVNQAHEAKPHLGGAVLMLLAVLSGDRFVRTGRMRDAVLSGVACGAAFGMVVSGALVFVILPVMALLRPMGWLERLRIVIVAGLVGLGTYAVTNPYVPINAICNPAVLRSNVGTSTDMYRVTLTLGGLRNAGLLVLEGASSLVAVAGLIGLIALVGRGAWEELKKRGNGELENEDSSSANRSAAPTVRPLAWLLAAPAVLVAVQFVLLAEGKPGEYGRFALVPDVGLLLAAFAAIDRFIPHGRDRVIAGALLAGSVVFFGGVYLRAFVRDSRPATSRLSEAQRLADLYDAGARTLAVPADPAPYCLPPVNLFEWRVLVLPKEREVRLSEPLPDVIVRAVDVVPPAYFDTHYQSLPALAESVRWPPRISWADKPFQVLVKRHLTVPPFAQLGIGVDENVPR